MKIFLIIYFMVGLVICILCCIEDLMLRKFCGVETDDLMDEVFEEMETPQDLRKSYKNLGFVVLSVVCIPMWPTVIIGIIKGIKYHKKD